MKSRELGAGIIGLGRIAARHAEAYQANPRVGIVAAYDPDPGSREVFARSWPGVAIVDSLEEFLSHASLDMVSICSPNSVHADQTVACLQAGKHVLVEKPVVSSAGEADKVRAAVGSASGLVAMGGMILRHHAIFRRIRDLYVAGTLGQLTLVSAGYWQRLDPSGKNYAWLTKRAYAGSAMLSAGTHIVDLLMSVVGSEVLSANAVSVRDPDSDFDYPPTEVGMLTFENGAVGTVEVSFRAGVNYLLSLDIVGTEAVIRDNQISGLARGGEWERLPFTMPTADMRLAPFQEEIDAFVSSVVSGRPLEADLLGVLAAHEICLALDRSAESGLAVRGL